MKPNSNTAPRNAQAQNHPPLARDGSGNPQSIPEGAVGWCLKRETGGRPKMIVGADRQPARFPLDLTADDIEEMVGAGTYRVYAIDADGEVLDYVTTVSVGVDESAPTEQAPASPGPLRGAGSDLRFALETILQMSRAQSDSLKAVALAQADWVKGLATAKALPRNGYPVVAPPATFRALDERESDEDDEDDDGDESDNVPVVPRWLEAVNAVAPVLQTYGELFKLKFAPPTPAVPEAPPPAVPEAPRNVAPEPPPEGEAPDPQAPVEGEAPDVTVPRNPMIHLSEINARLTGFERKFLNVAMRARQGGKLADMLLAMSVEEAVPFVKEQIALLQAERAASKEHAPPKPSADSPSAETKLAPAASAETKPGPVPADETKPAPAASGGAPSFMSHVLAASVYLTAEERATVMWMVPRFPAGRLEELTVKLLRMTPRDGAMWLRENLAALRAEVSA